MNAVQVLAVGTGARAGHRCRAGSQLALAAGPLDGCPGLPGVCWYDVLSLPCIPKDGLHHYPQDLHPCFHDLQRPFCCRP